MSNATYNYTSTVNAGRNHHIEQVFKFLESIVFKNQNTEDFVDSLRDFYLDKKFLTDKQYESLLNVYERV